MCTDRVPIRHRRRQAGISFVELVMFIVVVSVGIVGILSVMNVTSSHSADPLVLKQATAIAESLLEEIELQPFTYCDPTDDAVTTATDATSTGGCTTPESFGPEPGETRTTFNNVNDYGTTNGGETPAPGLTIIDVSDGSPISTLDNYKAFIRITEESIGGVPAPDSLRIDVRVTGPGGTNVTVTGYRMRYAPNAG
jgi:MSHA pilin protein MshD